MDMNWKLNLSLNKVLIDEEFENFFRELEKNKFIEIPEDFIQRIKILQISIIQELSELKESNSTLIEEVKWQKALNSQF